MTLSANGEEPLAYLTRMKSKDAEKGGDGLRTTREVAEYFGVTLAKARREMHKLHDAGVIGAYDNGNDHMGSPILWGLKA